VGRTSKWKPPSTTVRASNLATQATPVGFPLGHLHGLKHRQYLRVQSSDVVAMGTVTFLG
jgi:hypothetical protein